MEVPLTPEMLDLARPDLGDLRVVSDTGEEKPYVLRTAQGAVEAAPLEARLYNRTYLPGRSSSVTADFGREWLKDRIAVNTSGTNFRRRVTVESSDDGRQWQTVKDGDLLLRVSPEPESRGFEKNIVILPLNAQRYLRLTVQNDPEDTGRLDIQSVRAWQVVRIEPELDPVPIAAHRLVENRNERRTELYLDLGYRNLFLHELALRIEDADFFRGVRVLGRPSEERVVRVRVEDETTREKTVPEPWSEVAAGVVYRYTSGGTTEESPPLQLGGSPHRYLQVRIYNADDAPLRFAGAEATRLRRWLAFQPRQAGACFVYVGNAEASRPEYDISHYVERLRRDGVAEATLGPTVVNPTHSPPGKPVFWSERYAWLVWVGLLAALAILALLVYRQFRTVRAA